MSVLQPASDVELRDALAGAVAAGQTIRLGGKFTKDRTSGAGRDAATVISTTLMSRVLEYEPNDLTISVEAGLAWAELTRLLAGNRQMIPLDPPYFDGATVGGVVASNHSGPRRRLYGTARDLVIGMTFATMEGKLVKSGGMVVKNVAGLDMAKLMIGSMGTLAGIAVVNFKLAPMPAETRTFAMQFDSAQECLAARDTILKGALQPAAIDVLNPVGAKRVGLDGFALLVQAGGNAAVLDRYQQELPGSRKVEDEASLWTAIREFTPAFVRESPTPQVARVSCTLKQVAAAITSTPGPAIARAANGVCYLHFADFATATEWRARADGAGWRYVFEYGEPAHGRVSNGDFAMMEKLKHLFDPQKLLNPGRFYGRL